MRTLFINIEGEDIKSTENVLVLGGGRETLTNKCYYELGKAIIGDFFMPGINSIPKQDILTKFLKYDLEAYKTITTQLDLVKFRVLSKQPTGTFEIELPPQYTNWLKRSSDPVYNSIAKQIEQKKNIIIISIDNIYRRLLADIIKYGTHGCIQFVVNDNTVTDESALTIDIQKHMGGIAFLPYEEWVQYYTKDKQESTSIIEKTNSHKRSIEVKLLSEEREVKPAADYNNGYKNHDEFVNNLDRCNRDQMSFFANNSKTTTFVITKEGNGNLLFIINGINLVMVKVNEGCFLMGATEEQGNDASMTEKPVHEVKVDDFYICETVVTQKLWKAIMKNHHSKFKGDNRPVTNISYNDCMEFVKRLNSITGKTFRLPTEEEWEYAAREGLTKIKYKYCGSGSIDDVAWYSVNANKHTHDVKTKQPNALGIYDMSGNVWEWCATHFHKYGETEQGVQMITRGGCAASTPKACRTSRRYYCDPNHRSCYLGFRLAI